MNRSKKIACLAALGIVAALVIVSVIDHRQLQPYGVPLGAPGATFEVPEGVPFDLMDAKLISTGTLSFLSGDLADLRKPGTQEKLPGAVLDTQIPGRAEELRTRELQLSASAALTAQRLGHAQLGAEMLAASLLRGEKRQYIATLSPSGSVDIQSTLAGGQLQFFTRPGSATVLLNANVSPEDRNIGEPLMYQAFVSSDGGRKWEFDATQKVPAFYTHHGFVSEADGFELRDNRFLVTRNGGRAWAPVDLEKSVWQGTRPGAAQRFKWLVLAAKPGMAIGWSTRWERPNTDTQPEPAWNQTETRRFELRFEQGQPVKVQDIAPVTDITLTDMSAPYDLLRTPDGAATWKLNGRLRYLDPATWQWSQPASVPPIGDVEAWIDTFWVGDGLWVVKVRGNTIWNRAACWMPPFFSKTRNCDLSSASGHFVSRDKGRSWIPFVLNDAPSPNGLPEREIIGWDSLAQKLVVFRSRWRSRAKSTVEMYALPSGT